MSENPPEFDASLAYVADAHCQHVAARIRPYFGVLASGGMLNGAQIDELRRLVDATLGHLARAGTRPARDAAARNHLPT